LDDFGFLNLDHDKFILTPHSAQGKPLAKRKTISQIKNSLEQEQQILKILLPMRVPMPPIFLQQLLKMSPLRASDSQTPLLHSKAWRFALLL
jgi:hypothetical protein